MSTDAVFPKPSQTGDCPACHHTWPQSKACPGGPVYCGGLREGCPRCGQPVPTDIATPAEFVAHNAAEVETIGGATIGECGRWNIYHTEVVIEISTRDGGQRVVWYVHGLGRKERDAIIPRLVAAIEGVIEHSEGG